MSASDGHLVHTATSQGLSATCCGRFWHKETHLSVKAAEQAEDLREKIPVYVST